MPFKKVRQTTNLRLPSDFKIGSVSLVILKLEEMFTVRQKLASFVNLDI